MTRHWQVRRQVQPVRDGARRWDRAYRLILGWNASGSQTALTEADAAWLVSSVRLAAPVTAIDGTSIPVDHELTDDLNRYLLSPRD